MLPGYYVEIEEINPPDVTRRRLENIKRAALYEMGRMWYNDDFPFHFQQEGWGRYHFAKRTPATMKRKAKKFHHQKPLVFTGGLRDALESNAVIQATPSGVTIKMVGPNYVNYRGGKSKNGPDMVSEILQINDGENQELLEEAVFQINEGIDQEYNRQIMAMR